MIEIGKALISRDLLEKKFLCDLSACKGACCVAGDSGAPLEKEETKILEENFETVKLFMSPEGVAAVESQGKYVIDKSDGELVTPLAGGKECAYVNFDEYGIAKCSVEMAYNAGKIDFKKPLSCHLYPIRITEYPDFDAVNYHQWEICQPACNCGIKAEVKVYQFVKEALIRKYGKEWYQKLQNQDEQSENSG